MKRALIFLVFVVNTLSLAQNKSMFTNFRIFPSAVTKWNPSVAVGYRANALVMFASAVTINTNTGFRSEGVYVSTDGGVNWSGSDTCKGALMENQWGAIRALPSVRTDRCFSRTSVRCFPASTVITRRIRE